MGGRLSHHSAVRHFRVWDVGEATRWWGDLTSRGGEGMYSSVPTITKGGLNTVTRHLAIEYAKHGIRFNAVAPGVVDTPLHRENLEEHLYTLQPMGSIAEISDIVDAVLHLSYARQVTGETLHVGGGTHSVVW